MSATPASPPAAAGPVEGAPEIVDGHGTTPPAGPSPDRCPLCGTPLGAEQEWCLHCGAAARTRLATSSNWKAPIIAIATVAVLSLGVLAASLAVLAGSSSTPESNSTPEVTLPGGTPTTPTASSPAATTTTPATTPPVGSPGTASGPLSTEPTVTVPTGPAPTKVEIKELITGTGTEALPGDTVSVNYVGVLYEGGAQFDSSWRRGKRFSFALGTGQVISGWNEGVTGMKVGGRRELIVPASAAYGAQGLATRPVAIPPNAALVFVVDLLEVTRTPTSARPAAPTNGTTLSPSAQQRLRKLEAGYARTTSPRLKSVIREDEEHIRAGK